MKKSHVACLKSSENLINTLTKLIHTRTTFSWNGARDIDCQFQQQSYWADNWNPKSKHLLIGIIYPVWRLFSFIAKSHQLRIDMQHKYAQVGVDGRNWCRLQTTRVPFRYFSDLIVLTKKFVSCRRLFHTNNKLLNNFQIWVTIAAHVFGSYQTVMDIGLGVSTYGASAPLRTTHFLQL